VLGIAVGCSASSNRDVHDGSEIASQLGAEVGVGDRDERLASFAECQVMNVDGAVLGYDPVRVPSRGDDPRIRNRADAHLQGRAVIDKPRDTLTDPRLDGTFRRSSAIRPVANSPGICDRKIGMKSARP